MDLQEALRTTPACRYYKKDPVPDEVLARVFEAARFAPSGGNRQPLRFVVVRDAAAKKQLKEWYLVYWRQYLSGMQHGEVHVAARPRLVQRADDFANHLDEIPVLVVACADLREVYPTDHQLGRLSVVGGGSIYPTIQNLILACRGEGLGTCLTTLLCFDEPRVKKLLSIPEEIATVAMIPIGYPAEPFPKQLRRRPIEEFVFVDRYGASLKP
jgi:nitroreductase